MEGSICDSENLNEATPALTSSPEASMESNTAVRDDAISSTTSDKYIETSCTNDLVTNSSINCDAEADFLEAELNISNIRGEKITENVEDIVQDLENLLGESSDYHYGRESFRSHTEVNSTEGDSTYQEVTSADTELDNFNMEVTSLDEQALNPVDSTQNSEVLPDDDVDLLHSLSENIEMDTEKVNVDVSQSVNAELDIPCESIQTDKVDEVNTPHCVNTELDVACKDIQVETAKIDDDLSQSVHTDSVCQNVMETEKVDDVEVSQSLSTEVSELDQACEKSDHFDVLQSLRIDLSELDQACENIPAETVEFDVTQSLNTDISEIAAACGDIHRETEKTVDFDVPESSSADISEVDQACKNIQAETEKMDDELVQQDICTSQFVEVTPIRDNICEQSIAIASIMSEIEEKEEDAEIPVEIVSVPADTEENTGSITEVEDANNVSESISMTEVTEADEDVAGDADSTPMEEKEDDVAPGFESEGETHEPETNENEAEDTDNVSQSIAIASILNEMKETKHDADTTPQSIAVASISNEMEVRENDVSTTNEIEEDSDPEETKEAVESIVVASITDETEEKEAEAVMDTSDAHQVTASEMEDCNADIPPDTKATEGDVVAEVGTVTATEEDHKETVAIAVKETAEFISAPSELRSDTDMDILSVELSQPLRVDVEESLNDEDSNKNNRAPLKMTITKSKTDNVHSILKIYNPAESASEAEPIPNEQEKPTTSNETESQSSKCESLDEEKTNVVASSSDATNPTMDINLAPLMIADLAGTNDKLSPKTMVPYVEERHSPKITIKPIIKPVDNPEPCAKTRPDEEDRPPVKLIIKPVLKSPDDSHNYYPEKYSPKITIKPIVKPNKEEKQSIIKTALPTDAEEKQPKIIFKPIRKPHESILSNLLEKQLTKVTIKPIPKVEEVPEERHSPKITIKPIRKPSEMEAAKIMKKPIPGPMEEDEQRHSPKITIKPIIKPPEEADNHIMKFVTKKFPTDYESYSEDRHSPKITIKPVVKPMDDYQTYSEEKYNTKITIKPIPKPDHLQEERHSPKITIKPIKPPDDIQISIADEPKTTKFLSREEMEEKGAPRITIKPIIKPEEHESTSNPRITVKPIIKPHDHEDLATSQQPFKLNIKPVVRPAESSHSPKITIKPVQKTEPTDQLELIDFEEQITRQRIVLKLPNNRKKENERVNKIKVKLSKDHNIAQILPVKRPSSDGIESEAKYPKTETPSDLSISLIPNVKTEDSTGSDINIQKTTPMEDDVVDPLSEIPVFEITLESAMNAIPKAVPPPVIAPPMPRKRGRPRKVPLEVREEFKDPKEEPLEVIESTRPKRSCRGASVRTTLGIKPRKPRSGTPRGRVGRPPGSRSAKKERRPYVRKNLIKDSMIPDFKDFEAKHGEFKPVPLPGDSGNRDIVMYEEETRMSAENSSRAQTPAKQVLTSTSEVIEESQSSIQSNTTTESGEKLQKARKGPRLEVHQEPEGEVISADKLAEYSWGGGGPYMLQEQVAQFLGIKSFKRKYPGIQRRPVDMQERDFIRESCLASEAMCDMGLTAVKREDILDIMYTDFQHKYEEYCKHQRDRQAKDVSNKQKALSLAASQEKNKLDIVEQAVQSAFQWNANFNKARKEQRRACLDLQTFTVHYPKGKMKQINKPTLGQYPIALVPGQYSDYYKKYNPVELSKLPLNTVGSKALSVYHDTEDSQSEGSGSDSDSSSSDSDSSYSGSSVEDCKMCGPVTPIAKKVLVH